MQPTDKNQISKEKIKQIVKTSQAIEGYTKVSQKIKDEVKKLRAKYVIKVSV